MPVRRGEAGLGAGVSEGLIWEAADAGCGRGSREERGGAHWVGGSLKPEASGVALKGGANS